MNDDNEAERRVLERIPVRLRVNYRLMSPDEAMDYLESGNYSKLDVGPQEAGVNGTLENETKDISMGGFSLDGDLTILGIGKLERGSNLAVEILVPGVLAPVKAIAVVVWAKISQEEGNRTECGLMFKGISDADLDRIRVFMDRLRKK